MSMWLCVCLYLYKLLLFPMKFSVHVWKIISLLHQNPSKVFKKAFLTSFGCYLTGLLQDSGLIKTLHKKDLQKVLTNLVFGKMFFYVTSKFCHYSSFIFHLLKETLDETIIKDETLSIIINC